MHFWHCENNNFKKIISTRAMSGAQTLGSIFCTFGAFYVFFKFAFCSKFVKTVHTKFHAKSGVIALGTKEDTYYIFFHDQFRDF